MQQIGNTGRACWRSFSSVAQLLAFAIVFFQAGIALATVDNTVVATGMFMGVPVTDSASASVDVVDAAPDVTVLKDGILNDDDGIGGVSAGDTIDYTVSVENEGNVSLMNVNVSDVMLDVAPNTSLTYASGDSDNDGEIDIDETWYFSGVYILTQSDVDTLGGGDGDIDNTVTVTADGLGPVTASEEVPLNIAPDMEIAKNGVLNDDDGNPGLTAGDSITYTVTVENTGNIRLTNPNVTDPMLTLNYSSGDTNLDGFIDIDETWSFTGTTLVTQIDLDTLGGGDADIDNTATVNVDQLPPEDAIHELPIAPVSASDLSKTTTSITQLFPTIYEIAFNLRVANTGAVTQTNIRVEDNLIPAIAPGMLHTVPVIGISGFAGTGGVNVGYDGTTDTQLLVGDVQLAPGDIAQISITVQINVAAAGITGVNGVNTAYLDSDQITVPIPSDDPTQTPGDPNDVNPSPVDTQDLDGDGSPDDTETLDDRDGDGISNADDYDPTGYFYCQADGSILTGGLISVRNLATGGVQSGIGTSNDITIFQDGSNGFYQFHVTATGDYELFYSLPPGGVASTSLLTSGTLDVSTRTDNPVVIGSGEFGSTGILADFTPAANEFYTRFSIEAGDPAVFNNNIPLIFCGTPEVIVDKQVANVTATGIEYQITLMASGDEQVNNVQIIDDLDAAFQPPGSTVPNYTTPIVSLDPSTTASGVTLNAGFDGSGDIELLNSGINMLPGETIVVNLTVPNIGISGTYTNTAVATGESPLDSSAVTPSSSSAVVTFTAPSIDLVVTKAATPGAAPLGAPVTYTITVTNPALTSVVIGDIIDLVPNGMTYVPNSAYVDGVANEPTIASAQRVSPVHTGILQDHDDLPASGRELIWENITLLPEQTITVTLTMVINASAAAEEFINHAFVRDADGNIISNDATARVLLEIEPVFQCSDLIGRVFDDKNKDGYHDDGERGLAGVRIATARGLLITTDNFGRFSLPCAAIPDEDIGSNFIMKVDTRTLPTGYRLTSENPRVVRLTRGKLTKLNFAAANLRVVRIELDDASFNANTLQPTRAALQAIGQALPKLDEEASVLRLQYVRDIENRALVRSRIEGLEDLLRQAWSSRDRAHELKIETQILKR